MSKAVLDSNILIYRSNNLIDYWAVVAPYTELFISVIAYMEVMGYVFKNESDKLDLQRLMDTFTIIQTDLLIADHVIAYRKIRKVKLPDAITLATARRLDADLITLN
ncbi:MAG: PIN domain-containing protein, partial [Cytophagaceae bacterium]|nr:PIN domain-containing protein [Cytophagaceae bacterium]